MRNAERIYGIADNHAQTVRVCIDHLHKLGANVQLKVLAGSYKGWLSGPHRETITKQFAPLGANGDGHRILSNQYAENFSAHGWAIL